LELALRRDALVASAAMIAVTFGMARYAYGLFLPEIRVDMGLSTSTLGLIASCSYAAYMAAQLGASVLAARLGARLLVVIGGLAVAIGVLIAAAAQDAWTLALGVTVAGTSAGLVWPPLADVGQALDAGTGRSRALTAINAGTGWGVLVTGPAALVVGGSWRIVWIAIAAVALAVTWWNHRAIGGGGRVPRDLMPRLRWSWFVSPRSGPLFLTAVLLGVGISVYLTFAPDLIVEAAGDSEVARAVFWTLVGAAGITGAVTGDVISRIGIRGALAWSVLGLTVAIGVLAFSPGSWPAIVASGVLFGAMMMAVTGVIAVWTAEVFADRVSAGVGAVYLVYGVGQFAGPGIFGTVAEMTSMRTTFVVAACVCLSAVALRPVHR
jgi:predicted MFS family arabinose efflux permease